MTSTPRHATPHPATLGELRASGWASRPVADEIRTNTVTKIRHGEPLFEGVLGYENTVMIGNGARTREC